MIKISDTEYFSNDKTIRFINGDCNEFMKGLKENEFDLNLSDPPYGIDASNQTMGTGKNRPYKTRDKTWDKIKPSRECFDNIRKTSKHQVIFGGNYFELPLIKGWIIWDKMLNKEVSFADGEMAWNSFDKPLRIIKHQYNGFIGADPDCRIHETQKPIDLYRKLLNLYSKPTDTILDCFGGSKCDCGNIHTASSECLSSGKTKSCGCLKHESVSKKMDRELALYKNLYSHIKTRYKGKYGGISLTLDYFIEVSKQDCYYCGSKPNHIINDYRHDYETGSRDKRVSDMVVYYNGLDRIDSSIGYVHGNVVPCCRTCNVAKLDMTFNEFLDHIKKMYHHLFI